jgi:hypothetical protein
VGGLVKAMNEVYTAAEADKLGDYTSGWGRIGIETGIGIGIEGMFCLMVGLVENDLFVPGLFLFLFALVLEMPINSYSVCS